MDLAAARRPGDLTESGGGLVGSAPVPVDLRTYVRLRSDIVRYEVDVTIAKPLDDRNRQFLDAVQRSANRVVRFSGDDAKIKLTVEVAGLCREDAVRAAAGEVARIFPNSTDEKYGEPRPTPSC